MGYKMMFLTEEEEKERRRRAGYGMMLQDMKAIRQHREDMNFCPKCRISLTRTGKCSLGCDE